MNFYFSTKLKKSSIYKHPKNFYNLAIHFSQKKYRANLCYLWQNKLKQTQNI